MEESHFPLKVSTKELKNRDEHHMPLYCYIRWYPLSILQHKKKSPICKKIVYFMLHCIIIVRYIKLKHCMYM